MGTSGFQKTNFFPDLFLGGPREYYTEKWLKNSKKNSLVLGGLTVTLMRSTNNIFRRGIGGEMAPTFWILFADKLAMVTEIILFFQLNIRWDIDCIWGINVGYLTVTEHGNQERRVFKNSQISFFVPIDAYCTVYFNSTLILYRLQQFWPFLRN